MKTKLFLAGAFSEHGTGDYIQNYEQAHLDAGAQRRLMAFGRKTGDQYAELFKTKIFLAGSTGPRWRERAAVEHGAAQRLWSFDRKDSLVTHLPFYESWRTEHENLEVMLDSGAFSAHSRGIVIDLQEYAEFITKYADVFSVVFNLDVIPGKPGTGLNHDPVEAARAAEAGWQNWMDLRAALTPTGITPIPVYHLGEPIKWLKRMRDETDYIGLGGIRHGTLDDKCEWLDSLMPLLTDDDGWPMFKVHGLAATSFDVMERYPFHSVDSASWMQTGNNGAILVPRGVMGSRPQEIVFSNDPRALHNRTRDHFRSLADVEREPVLRYLESKGMTPRMLAENFCLACGTTVTKKPLTCCAEPKANVDYIRRDAMNIAAWLEIERSLEPRPWRR